MVSSLAAGPTSRFASSTTHRARLFPHCRPAQRLRPPSLSMKATACRSTAVRSATLCRCSNLVHAKLAVTTPILSTASLTPSRSSRLGALAPEAALRLACVTSSMEHRDGATQRAHARPCHRRLHPLPHLRKYVGTSGRKHVGNQSLSSQPWGFATTHRLKTCSRHSLMHRHANPFDFRVTKTDFTFSPPLIAPEAPSASLPPTLAAHLFHLYFF